MKLVAPLLIDRVESDESSITLRKSSPKITINKFTIKEKEDFFGLQELIISNGNTKSSLKGLTDQRLLLEYHPYILARYKIEIEISEDEYGTIQKHHDNLDFAFNIVVGTSMPLYKIEGGTFKIIGPLIPRSAPIHARNLLLLSNEKITRVNTLFSKLKNSQTPKINLLRETLKEAIAALYITGLKGALYVTLIESIVCPDGNPEIGYKLRMRLTKLNNQNEEYLKKIRLLYNKRSKVYHEGEKAFSKEDVIFAEKEACHLLEQYIIAPEKFTPDNLDKLLLEIHN